MKTSNLTALALGAALGAVSLCAQTGPFSPDNWPTTVNPNALVHYVDTTGLLEPPSFNWQADTLRLLTGGDQVTQDISIGGRLAKKVTGTYLNVADLEYWVWANSEFIDILVQVYGDAALFNAQGQPRNFNFLTGTLPGPPAPNGGQVPIEANNKKWNWVLFRIPNGIRASDGTRYVGSIPANAQGNTQYGGVNGGTIRFQGVPNLIVRVVAFGDEGAFGAPEDINKFSPAEVCDPEPETNLARIDIGTGVADHMQVIDNGDQTVTYEDNVGPAGDKRRAVRPNGIFLNFGVTDNYLGKPCNDPRSMKVCVDFYDDPAFAGAGVWFGPEAYATDELSGIGIFPINQRHLCEGTGRWIRRSWVVPAVNLRGVNAGALTAGPRFASENGQVFVSRFELGVLRTGTHPLAGIDPLADCYSDPNICTDLYGNYVELDVHRDVRDGLDFGSSGGDQEMIVEEAGPVGDRRMAVRPAREDGTAGFTHQYLNFAIRDQALGPSSQPPARLAICVTYYDDPTLVGRQFKPEVYITEVGGNTRISGTPDSFFVVIEGTDQWREAYWEIADMKFNGVNQGPQAAARFTLNDKIFFTRIRYAVIRPCGPLAGVNLLEECKPLTEVPLGIARDGNNVRLSWPARAEGFALEQTSALVPAEWLPVATAPEVQGDLLVVTLPIESGTRYYRLAKP
ncbi:MAG: hypothetical protein FJ387_12280 [Verrucomicrobia bacterium]|nr:hypothetical protein [Verrucomicrobiota bacterium]